MRTAQIREKSGGFRTIYKPSYAEKNLLRNYVDYLTELAYHRCPSCVHGFMPGRNAVTNAAAHIGYRFTLCMDLKDFFEHVTAWHLERIICKDLLDVILVDGAARQGLPTSPAAANIAAADMDAMILTLLARLYGSNFAYTRYADDLSISCHLIVDGLVGQVEWLVHRCRFKVNDKKTRIQDGNRFRRVITGVAIEGDRLYPTRSVKRELAGCEASGEPGVCGGFKGVDAVEDSTQLPGRFYG